MARRKQSDPDRRDPLASTSASATDVGTSAQPRTDPQGTHGPSQAVVWLVSAALVVHLLIMFLSYSAIIEPSSTHSKWLDAAAPYLRSTHFAADGRPFYLAHDTPDEQPHRLQFASRGDQPPLRIDSQTQWTTVEPSGVPGLAAWDRYGKWMTLAATLAQSDRPSLTAALLTPLIARDDATIDAIRIVRLPTQLTTAAEDAAPPVYLARVVRSAEGARLVSIGPKRLSTYPRVSRDSTNEANDSAAEASDPAAEASDPAAEASDPAAEANGVSDGQSNAGDEGATQP